MKTNLFIVLVLMLAAGALRALPNIEDSYNQENKGYYASALDVMLELQAADAKEPFYQVRIAWLQYLLGRYEEAIASYRKALALLENLDARTGIINCLLALGRYPEAIAEVDEQLKTHRQNPTLISKGAYAAYMKKDYARAVTYYQTMIAIYPWDFESRGYLVNNLFLAGQNEEGQRQLLLLKKYYPQSAIVEQYKDKLK